MSAADYPLLSGFYRTLIENTLDGLAYCQMLFDRDGQPVDFIYLEVNQNFTKLTGLKDVVGKKVTVVIPGVTTTNPELFIIYGRVAATGKPERFESFIKQLDIWFSVSVFCPKKDYFVVVFQNITAQKKVEQELLDSKRAASNVLEDLSLEKNKAETAQAKEEAIIMSIGEGLIATDAAGQITLLNGAAAKMIGKKSDALIGKLFYDELVLVDEKGVPIGLKQRCISLALTTGVTTVHTVTDPTVYLLRADKTRFPIAFVTSPIKTNGKVIGAVQAFRDITHEKEIDRAKTEFVSLASHQLRTPTTAIGWFSEMLLDKDIGPLTAKQREYLTEISQGNQRMIELVNALLNVSRIELGTFNVKPEPTDIKAITDDVLKELDSQIKEKRLLIERGYAVADIIIANDPKMMRMIIQNLLTNAVEYTPTGGKITVTLKQSVADLQITVSDNGCGIPQSSQSQIFTKFFRADNGRVLKSDGTGLGLYLTKLILQSLGGTISFDSIENRGTTFRVSLPTKLKK